MCQLVLFVVSAVQRYENAQIMCSSNNANIGSCEFRTELVEPSSGDALLRTIDIECGNGRMVGGLFCEVGELDTLVASDTAGATRRL